MVGIAGELVFEGRTFIVEDRQEEQATRIVGSLGVKAEEADQKAKAAIADSSTALGQAQDALSKAGKAQESLGKAETEANQAQTASTNALTLATGARQEADSFEKDIKSAKEQAASAESHLAEALKEASSAQAELNLLKTPRSLTNVQDLISALAPFKDTQFGFLGIYGDQESQDLAEEICNALQLAGWKATFSRTSLAEGAHVRLKCVNFSVYAIPTVTGVHIGITSDETRENLSKLSLADQPRVGRAAFALRNTLAASVSPKQEDLRSEPVSLEKPWANIIEVTITVGQKPMIKSASTGK